jgi:hypothetical protein
LADISQQIELAAIHPTNYSDNCPASVQRRATMPQRSPIIVGLLFAASVSSCGVALSWARARAPSEYGYVAYFALLTGYLSVVCIWSALRPKVNAWSRVAPIASVIAVSIGNAFIDSDITDFLAFFGLQAAGLLVGLWVFRRSGYWRRRSGIESDWQFSMGQLLIVTTVVALLSAALRYSDLFDGESVLVFAFLAASVALALASVFIWSRPGRWPLQLASTTATAFAFGAFFYAQDEFMEWFSIVHFLVQGLVFSAWIGLGGILPIKEVTVADER